jgi:hypothetical protein
MNDVTALPELCESISYSCMSFSRRSECRDLDVQVLLQVLVLRIGGNAKLFLLKRKKEN